MAVTTTSAFLTQFSTESKTVTMALLFEDFSSSASFCARSGVRFHMLIFNQEMENSNVDQFIQINC